MNAEIIINSSSCFFSYSCLTARAKVQPAYNSIDNPVVPNTPEQLARMVVECFRRSDFKLYSSLFLSPAHCDSIIKHTSVPDENKSNSLNQLKFQVLSEDQKSSQFYNFVNICQQNKIDLKNIKFIAAYSEPITVNNVARGDIYISCRSGKKRFAILLPDCILSGNTWVMRSLTKIHFE